MKQEQDYKRDLAEIRSMMERSSKFLSLSGWAGVLAGILALIGAYLAYYLFLFRPEMAVYGSSDLDSFELVKLFTLALVILVLAVVTAIILSYRRATRKAESIWNPTSRKLLINMGIPLTSGGLLILILIAQGLMGLIMPMTLIFYGLSLFNAGNFTFRELRYLGLIEIALGLMACCWIKYSVLIWSLGFGLMHIIYGIYIHLKYQQ
ncbi:MAG: hypothetical protein KDC53_24500 [Saprospiraceae bacterium]|nr:hypothetical protein [Saprospiraceae bacterium]